MKKTLSCLFFFLFIPCLSADNTGQSNNYLLNKYNIISLEFIDKTSWSKTDKSVATDSEKAKLQELQSLANQIVHLQDSHPIVIKILRSYQDHDGYSRQILFNAIVHGDYSKVDFVYLKQIFLLSINFQTEEYPLRLRGWTDPKTFRFALAEIITNILNSPQTSTHLDEANINLLDTDPKSWIDKQHP